MRVHKTPCRVDFGPRLLVCPRAARSSCAASALSARAKQQCHLSGLAPSLILARAPAPSKRQVRASAEAGSVSPYSIPTRVQPSVKWWQKEAELWVIVNSEEDFKREVFEADSDKLVLVDWYATWCQGCERAYPEVCKAVRHPDVQANFKMVKVCVDTISKTFANHQGVTMLPKVSVYKPGQGRLVVIDVPFSKVRHLRHNLMVVAKNPGMSYSLDPHGFVVASSRKEQEGVVAGKAAAPHQDSKDSMFGKLMALSRAQQQDGQGHASSSGAAASHASHSSSSNGNGASGSSSGNGHAAGGSTRASNSSSGMQDVVPAASSSSSGGRQPSMRIPPLDAGIQDTESYQSEKAAFLNRHPEYGYGGQIDTLYPNEVGVRMLPGEHYLDYTGSAVYCQSQLQAVFHDLATHMYGNPHSGNPSSSLATSRVDDVRAAILRLFNADPREYQVVFTRSATGALQVVGETFPWTQHSLFRYLRENHNSVLGIREYALKAGASFQAVAEPFVEHWVRTEDGRYENSPPEGVGSEDKPVYSLFAFPAEDNFAGVKYPLSWVRQVSSKSSRTHRWLTLVDAAAYVPTQPLDLTAVQPDFVDVAFYKMFGYPTGLGALLVRTEVVPLMHKTFWGGGTVALATSSDNFHVLKCRPSEALEDGTISFLDIIALQYGMEMMDRLGGVRSVQAHVSALTEWLHQRLSSLDHSNGRPMARVYGKHGRRRWQKVQGGILNFNLLSPEGEVLSYKEFEKECADAGFHIRVGSECNPGACYAYVGVREEEIEALAGLKEGCQDELEFILVERPLEDINGPAPTAPASVPVPPIHNRAEGRKVPSTRAREEGERGVVVHISSAEVAGKTMTVLSSVESVDGDLAPGPSLQPGQAPSTSYLKVPLGSIRVSLGYMSTFEDCFAFVEFVSRKYKDRWM